MGEPPYLDRAQMEEAFRIMGQYLLDRKALGEIAVYGGSAILFQFDWRKTSQDVDARVTSDGNHGLVMEAAAEAARRLGLLRSWLNESVTMYAHRGEGVGDRVLIGSYPSPERCGLRVTAAKPAYILAMKLGALERPRVTIAISVTPLNLVSSATSRRSMSRTRSFASSSPTVSCRLRRSCV